MKDPLAWLGLKAFPFDKNLKTQDVFEAEPFKEAMARFDYIKRRGGILLLTGDPGVGKTLVLRRYVDTLNGNLFKPYYTPLSTLSRADLLYHLNRFLGLPPRLSKSAVYGQIQKIPLESKESSGKVVFLIDEVHLLQTGPLEELRLPIKFKKSLLRKITLGHWLTELAAKGSSIGGEDLKSSHREPKTFFLRRLSLPWSLCLRPTTFWPRIRSPIMRERLWESLPAGVLRRLSRLEWGRIRFKYTEGGSHHG